jgi:exosortase D (VPLPA-CTERM-specific)
MLMSVPAMEIGPPRVTVWRLSWGLAFAALVVCALSLWPFWDGLSAMWVMWVNTPEYSYGLLIPPVAAFLVWQQKDRLEHIRFVGSWVGVVVVLLGGAILVMGQLGTVYTLVQYAYMVTLYGLILSFLGWPGFRVLAVPQLILLFMIPLPQFILYNLSAKLQLLSSQLGVGFMRLFNVSVFLEGNVIDLGGYKLQVADACSGLRYLFPLMTIGFLMAYFYKGALWKRFFLFLSSIPITILMNSFRVGIIGITVEHWGIGMAEGFLHEFQGWMVFMLSTALMLGEIAALNKVGHERGTWRELFGLEFPAPTPIGAQIRRRKLPVSFLASSALLVMFVAVGIAMPRSAEIYPARASFSEFPAQLGPWRGHNEALEQVYLDQLKLDDYVLANYVVGAGPPVNFYVSYYNSQRKGDAVHSPRSCLPGGGWQMRDFAQRELPLVTVGSHPLHVNRVLIELGDQRQLVYYWFQQRGRIITNEFVVKWYLFWDALTRHRTDGAMVRLITPLPVSASETEADQRLTDFAARVASELPRFAPD